MKIKISIVILILLSFFNIGAVSDSYIKVSSFNNLETIFENKSEFVENGSKIQYKTINNVEDERDRIKRYIIDKFNVDCNETEENKINFYNEDVQIYVQLWNEDMYTYAAITVVNNNLNYTTEDLESMIQGLITDAFQEVQCYRYYKGRISFDKEHEYTKDICNSIYKSEMLDLNNGYTGNGYCSDGEKVNFATSNYNTGAYIIIGTPIIFATY